MPRRRGTPPKVLGALLLLLLVSMSLPPAHGQGATVTGIGPWTQQNNYGSSSTSVGTGGVSVLGVSCVTDSGYAYCVGGQNPMGTDLSDVFYAQLNSDGSVGAWTETTDYGAASGTSGSGGVGVEWPSCVVSAGYVYCVGGANTSEGILSDSFYAQLSTSGVGPWTETTDYGAASGSAGAGGVKAFQLSCVADGGYVYCVGGGSSKTFYAQLSSSGIGPWTETTDYGAASGSSGSGGVAIDSNSCVDGNGTVYCVGGTLSFKPVSDVFSAPLSSAGVGAWTEETDYGGTSGTTGSGGVPIYGTNCLFYSSYVVCIAGDTTGNSGTAGVYYAQDGALGGWVAGAALPFATYWLTCAQAHSRIYCWGAGSSSGFSAMIQTGGTVGPAQPSLTTSISEVLSTQTLTAVTSSALGYKVFDTATLSGGNSPTGTITYTYYQNGACSGSGSSIGMVTVNGNGPAPVSGQVLPTSPGSYSLRAQYSGDPLNAPAQSPCEALTVIKNSPTVFTVLNPSATVTPGQVFHDSAGFSSLYTPASGTVTYNWFQGGACSGNETELDMVDVGSDGTVPPSTTTAFSAGTYSFQAVYSGDGNNNPDTSTCEVLTVSAGSSSGGGGGVSTPTILAIIGAAVALAILAWFLYGRKRPKPPPPPPAQPVSPPPTPTVGPPVVPPPTAPPPPPPPPPPPVIPTEETPIQPVTPPDQTEGPGCVQMVRWLHQSIDLHLFVNKDPGRFLTLIDQPVPLGAWGTDSHLLIHECSCPGVDGDTSRETVKMRADTRITWKVIEGPGTFLSRNFRIDKEVSEGIWETPWYYPILDGIVDVKSKYLGKRVGKEVYFTQFGYGGSATGGQVIFQPPHLSPDQSVACKIQVTMAHADYTKDPEEHEQAQALLEMWITRRGEEYLYVYNKADDIQYGQGRHQPPDLKGVCRPRHHWRQLKGIHAKLTWVDPFDPEHGRTGLPPDVIYPNKVPVNDYVEIMLDQSDDYFGDMDLLQLDCTPTGEGPCKAPSHKELQLSDTLVLTWSSDRGDFPLLKARKEWESTHNLTKVVWHAPATPGDAQVKVRIADSSKEFLDEPIELTLDLQVEVDPNVPK